MFALPIIERELRVRSRRPLTIWLRVGVGVGAVLMAITNLRWMSWGMGAGAAGKQMFLMLAWIAFAFCLVEGGRCAADALSHEKRDGTLGFLLLSDLSGFEVVMGKFVAVSLTAFYTLLATFPAMALALPAGGVTAGEFWRTQAVLLDTLFLAVAIGLWVSAHHVEVIRTFFNTLGVLAIVVLLPGIHFVVPTAAAWPSPSPGLALSLAEAGRYSIDPGRFWGSLVAVQALAWLFLILAGRAVAQSWRSDTAQGSRGEHPGSYNIPPSLHSDPARKRRELLEQAPVRWLARRDRPKAVLIWLAILVYPALQFGYSPMLQRFFGAGTGPWVLYASFIGAWVIGQLVLASLVSHRWATDQSSGALELLLASPLSVRQIVYGRWWGIWQQIRVPLLVGALAPIVIHVSLGQPFPMRATNSLLSWAYQISNILTYPAHVLAVCWLAMWLGVRTGSTARASGLTLLWTMVVPYILQMMLSLIVSFVRPMNAGPGMSNWMFIPIFIQLCSGLLYAAGVTLWARRQLLTRLREGRPPPQRTFGPPSNNS